MYLKNPTSLIVMCKWQWWWMLWDWGFLLGSEACETDKVKHEKRMIQGSKCKGPPIWLSSYCINHIFRQSWSIWVSSFSKSKGKPWQLDICDSGTQRWAQLLWKVSQVLTKRSRRTACEMPFWRCEDPERRPRWQKSHMGYVDANERHTVKIVSYHVDSVLWSFVLRFRKVQSHGWAVNTEKIPSLKGWTQCLWGFCGSLIKNPQEWSCPCGSFPAISQGQMMDWTWSWKIKALNMWRVALLAPGGQGLQYDEFQVIPGIEFFCILGMQLFVVVATAAARCKSKGQCYLPREYCRRLTAYRMWGKRPWKGGVWERAN